MKTTLNAFDRSKVLSLNPAQGGSLKERVVEFLATGFYSGKSPKAPGTMGTLVAIPITWGLAQLGALQYMLLTFLLVLAAIFISQLHENAKGEHDSSEIVIDEIVGYLIAMTWLPFNAVTVVASFVLFRIFDIWKPFPIGHIDKRIDGGLGVVADDVAAGLLANVVLQIIFVKTTWLGVQWVGG